MILARGEAATCRPGDRTTGSLRRVCPTGGLVPRTETANNRDAGCACQSILPAHREEALAQNDPTGKPEHPSGFPCGQESVDQLGQLVAIAAFENCAGWDPALAHPLTEEREIVGRQTHLGNRVPGKGIKTRGDEQEVGRNSRSTARAWATASRCSDGGANGATGKLWTLPNDRAPDPG